MEIIIEEYATTIPTKILISIWHEKNWDSYFSSHQGYNLCSTDVSTLLQITIIIIRMSKFYPITDRNSLFRDFTDI